MTDFSRVCKKTSVMVPEMGDQIYKPDKGMAMGSLVE
jgi:hypothetical protein